MCIESNHCCSDCANISIDPIIKDKMFIDGMENAMGNAINTNNIFCYKRDLLKTLTQIGVDHWYKYCSHVRNTDSFKEHIKEELKKGYIAISNSDGGLEATFAFEEAVFNIVGSLH